MVTLEDGKLLVQDSSFRMSGSKAGGEGDSGGKENGTGDSGGKNGEAEKPGGKDGDTKASGLKDGSSAGGQSFSLTEKSFYLYDGHFNYGDFRDGSDFEIYEVSY